MSSALDYWHAMRALHRDRFGEYPGTAVPITPVAFVPDARRWIAETSSDLPHGSDLSGRARCTGQGEPWEPLVERAMAEAGADFGGLLATDPTPEELLGWASTPLRLETAHELWEELRSCALQFDSLGVIPSGWEAYGQLGGALVESVAEGEPVEAVIESAGALAEFSGLVVGKAAGAVGRGAGAGLGGVLSGLAGSVGGLLVLGLGALYLARRR